MMGLARSSYYYKPKPSKEIEELRVRDAIEQIHLEFPGYGYRRIDEVFRREGLVVNHKRIKRIMRKFGLRSCLTRTKTKFRWAAKDEDGKVFKNHLSGLELSGINQAWATDITYIKLKREFVFLAAIIDIYSRKIVGWAISRQMSYILCMEALIVALRKRNPPEGVIHHSDQGVQYCSIEYVRFLKENGFKISMSARGTPTENGYIESFFKTLKYEEIFFHQYQTMEDVVERLPKFIEEVYNKKRLHSSLEYQSPAEFEEKLMEKPGQNAHILRLVSV
jgi:putative transposase